MTEREEHLVRVSLLQRGGRFAFPVPDAFLAVIFALAALTDFLSPEQLVHWPAGFIDARDELFFGLVIEGGFLLMQGTLVDIATRLKKRPPIWLIVLIVIGVAIFSGQSLEVIRMAWQQGAVVFIPILISLAQRATILWHMPTRTPIEKIAARALVANRITTGLACLAFVLAMSIVSTSWPHVLGSHTIWPPFAAGAIYFAIAAIDDARVRRRKFAENPRVLFGWDPIGIKYLEPV